MTEQCFLCQREWTGSIVRHRHYDGLEIIMNVCKKCDSIMLSDGEEE